jgi:hypothetical protein
LLLVPKLGLGNQKKPEKTQKTPVINNLLQQSNSIPLTISPNLTIMLLLIAEALLMTS